jgi:hypothetical protein
LCIQAHQLVEEVEDVVDGALDLVVEVAFAHFHGDVLMITAVVVL